MIIEIIPWSDLTIPEAGKCYSGMPNEVYHGLKSWWSSSDLKHVRRSVESFYYELEQEHKGKLCFERGGAFHVAMEGLACAGTLKLFDRLTHECPTKTILTKAWRDLKTDFPECYVLPEKERENVRKMTAALYAKTGPDPHNFFAEGWPELSFFWVDEETGFQLKCRPDWLRPNGCGKWIILDYKTSKNHQLEAFRKDAANLGYHFSAAMYEDGVEAVTGIPVKSFRWLVVANTPPHECACYPMGVNTRSEGLAQFRRSLRDIYDYAEPDGLVDEVLELPGWAFKET